MRLLRWAVLLANALAWFTAAAFAAQQPRTLRLGVNNWPFWRTNQGVT